jgi:hypothetical protein
MTMPVYGTFAASVVRYDKMVAEKVRLRREYRQSDEYVNRLFPRAAQWQHETFHVENDHSEDDRRHNLRIGSSEGFDFLEAYDSARIYAPIWKNASNEQYETTIIVFYNALEHSAKHYVGYTRKYSPTELDRLKEHCPCELCQAPWWSIDKYFGCPGRYGCLKSVTYGYSHPSLRRHLKTADAAAAAAAAAVSFSLNDS